MTSIKLRFVKAYADRHGRQRYYVRRRGMQTVALSGEPGSKEFMEAYDAALKGAPKREIGAERSQPGSFSALIVAYYASADFKTLAEITRKTYRNDLERFRTQYGALSVAGLEARHIRKMLDDLADKPGAAYSRRRIIRILMRFAVERGWRKDNPALGVRRVRGKSGGFVPWSEAEIAQYEAYWKPGSRERIALALFLYTAQRRADVAPMGKQHVRGSKIHVAQAKSGGKTKLWIPMHPNLIEALSWVPADQLTFLITQEGKPFTPAGLTNWFSASAREAGLPSGRAPHGLRKAALRRLADAGATGHQIKAVSGHQHLAEVDTYTASADQERLADSALALQLEDEKRTSGV